VNNLKSCLLLLFAPLVSGVAEHASAASPVKPDILLIMPDQMRGDCVSRVSNRVVRTPHLDELAQQGALFVRAYSTCPSCIPARHSLLTGLYPSSGGVVGYAGRPITAPTLPQLLGEAGYTSVLVGRYMHQAPPNESYGYEKEVRGSTYIEGDDYDTFLKQSAPATGGIRELVSQLGLSMNGWEAKPWPLIEEWHPTAWTVAQGRKILGEVSASKPLFLTVSFFAPHSPLFPPRRYFEYYRKQRLPRAAHGDWVDWKALSTKGDGQGHRVLLEGEALRDAQAGYFGLIEHLDEQIGPLIAGFKQRSQRANRPWIIVVTSDHGEMLGDHGFFRKCEPYEGAAKIPFIIAGSPELGFQPDLRPVQPVCLEDLMPTLLSLAGGKTPTRLDGINLTAALRGEQRLIREWLHCEHATCYSAAQAFHSLTDGRHKYIWRPLDGREQFFDLDHDPREEHDLVYDDSSGILLAQCRKRLVKVLAGRPEGFSDGMKLIAGRPYPPLQRTMASREDQ
jgi:arylsulfatase A-like enzyme